MIATALAASSRDVEYLVGPPGTGKTTLLRAARAAWESGGYRVAGAATAAVAAQNLAAESGISSRTLAQWRWTLTQPAGGGFDDIDVLVLDEANLPLNGRTLQILAPLDRVLLMFATRIIEAGTTVDFFYGPGTFSPGLLLDLDPAVVRSVSYEIDYGWSWDEGTWAWASRPRWPSTHAIGGGWGPVIADTLDGVAPCLQHRPDSMNAIGHGC